MRMGVRCALILALAASACAKPPAPAPVRAPTMVSAGFDATWNAVIDIFAEKNIPIRTIDKDSGIIATDRLAVPEQFSLEYADCGTDGFMIPQLPTSVIYNILVRENGDATTVRVTASWSSDKSYRCNTRGIWEGDLEANVKDRAERGRPGANDPTPTRS